MTKTAAIIISIIIYISGLLFGAATVGITPEPEEPAAETTEAIDRSHDSTEPTGSTAIPDETTAAFETITETEPETTAPETETTAPETTKAPEAVKAEPEVKLVSVTSPIDAGEFQTLTIKGKPDTEYAIKVYYRSSASKADGLESKKSDANGNASWTWKVGTNTASVTAKADIYESGKRSRVARFTFDVIEVAK